MSQTKEAAFEHCAHAILLTQSGWKEGSVGEWDKARALFPARVVAFLKETQPKLWAQMEGQHAALEPMLIDALVKELALKGTLNILRHGFKFYGKTFRLAHFKPAHGLNFEVLELYGKNELTISRQVPCHAAKSDTVDMLLALNGLPVATVELKNPGTAQTWRHAAQQYREDRDEHAPLFEFKQRALVHFAVDPDEVHMRRGWPVRRLTFSRSIAAVIREV